MGVLIGNLLQIVFLAVWLLVLGRVLLSWFDPEVLDGAMSRLADLRHLELRGLMTVGRLVEQPEDARPTFIALRELSKRLRATGGSSGSGLGHALSMGMSDDYPIAIEEGATIVRVGRALFGERHHH